METKIPIEGFVIVSLLDARAKNGNSLSYSISAILVVVTPRARYTVYEHM